MFDFTINPKITKEFLLSKNSEETYMSYYIGIPIKKGLFKKAMELALLCDVKVFVAVFSKEQQLSIVSTSDKPHLFIDKYLHKPIQINEFYSIKDYPSLFHSRGCSNINFNNVFI